MELGGRRAWEEESPSHLGCTRWRMRSVWRLPYFSEMRGQEQVWWRGVRTPPTNSLSLSLSLSPTPSLSVWVTTWNTRRRVFLAPSLSFQLNWSLHCWDWALTSGQLRAHYTLSPCYWPEKETIISEMIRTLTSRHFSMLTIQTFPGTAIYQTFKSFQVFCKVLWKQKKKCFFS